MLVPLLFVLIGIAGCMEHSGNPCQNKTCIEGQACTTNQVNPEICECMRGFIGDDCSDINECKIGHGDPCDHRGLCTNTVGSFVCVCLPGWDGTHCDHNTTSDPPCMPGYSGKRCKVSACDHGYVVNDTSTNTTICYCDTGWTHVHKTDTCSDDIDECANNKNVCQNGGTCHNTNGSYRCDCIKPWQGKNCSDYNTCLPNPCENGGTCKILEKNVNKTYKCSCTSGWHGFNCSDDVDECMQKLTEICLHGNCTNYPGSYNCTCLDDWAGESCNESIISSTSTFTSIETTESAKSNTDILRTSNSKSLTSEVPSYSSELSTQKLQTSTGSAETADGGTTRHHLVTDIVTDTFTSIETTESAKSNTDILRTSNSKSLTSGVSSNSPELSTQKLQTSQVTESTQIAAEGTTRHHLVTDIVTDTSARFTQLFTTETTNVTPYELLSTETEDNGSEHIAPESTKTDNDSSQHISVIVGITVGGIAAIIACSLIGYILYKRKRAKVFSTEEMDGDQTEN